MNLIHDNWIPVIRQDGSHEVISPGDLTNKIDSNPVSAIRTPRPDLNAALIQLLIGLVQTAIPPVDETEWVEKAVEPPSPNLLKRILEPFETSFLVDGDGPRFMQDFALEDAETWEIQKLFFGMPGEKTLKENKDLFLKRGSIQTVCVPCAAMALYCVQINTGGLGSGHRTSIRGGGPLTSIVVGENLWQTVWFNVLEEDAFNPSSISLTEHPEKAFPWLAPTRTSERDETTTPDDVHPSQQFFSMPIRARLVIDHKQGVCDICGENHGEMVGNVQIKNKGVNYSGNWNHPLTPYGVNLKKRETRSVKMGSGGIVYQHWLGLIQRSQAGTSDLLLEPARSLTAYKVKKDLLSEYLSTEARIWAFGYEVDSGKARAWYEGTLPLITVGKEYRAHFEATVEQFIITARLAASSLQFSVSHAMYKYPERIRGGQGKFTFINEDFWKASEMSFYSFLAEIANIVPTGTECPEYSALKRRWVADLGSICLILYDRYANSDLIAELDPKRIALNRRSLEFRVSIRNPYVCSVLHMEAPDGVNVKKKKGRKKVRDLT